jgi:hypothetical protein
VDGTVNGDLFVAGSDITVGGTVNGNLFVGGQNFRLTGKVTGSLLVGATAANVAGKVDGSMYSGAYTVALEPQSEIGRNVYFGGYSLEQAAGSKVSKDIFAAGYQAVINGQAGRDLQTSTAALALNGKVGGNVIAEVSAPGQPAPQIFSPNLPPVKSIPSGLAIGPDAQIGGKLTYTSPVRQDARIQARPEGGVDFTQKVTPTPRPGAQPTPAPLVSSETLGPLWGVLNWFINLIRILLSLLIVAGLALWLLPGYSDRVVRAGMTRPWPAFGWGLVVFFVGFPVLGLVFLVVIAAIVVLALITLGGLAGSLGWMGLTTVSLATAIFVFTISFVSKVAAAYAFGRWLVVKVSPQSHTNRWVPMLIGVAIYALLRSIPFLGVVFGILATLFGLGAIYMVLKDRLWPPQPQVAGVEPVLPVAAGQAPPDPGVMI